MNYIFGVCFFPNIITLRLLGTIRLVNIAFLVYLLPWSLLFGSVCF